MENGSTSCNEYYRLGPELKVTVHDIELYYITIVDSVFRVRVRRKVRIQVCKSWQRRQDWFRSLPTQGVQLRDKDAHELNLDLGF